MSVCPCQVPGFVGECTRTECQLLRLRAEITRLRALIKDSPNTECTYCNAAPGNVGLGCPICERFRTR